MSKKVFTGVVRRLISTSENSSCVVFVPEEWIGKIVEINLQEDSQEDFEDLVKYEEQ